MKVIFIKSRGIFGIVRPDSPVGSYIHYRGLDFGLGCKLCNFSDVVDISDYIENPRKWTEEEIETINMVLPEFSKELLTSAAKFARIAG